MADSNKNNSLPNESLTNLNSSSCSSNASLDLKEGNQEHIAANSSSSSFDVQGKVHSSILNPTSSSQVSKSASAQAMRPNNASSQSPITSFAPRNVMNASQESDLAYDNAKEQYSALDNDKLHDMSLDSSMCPESAISQDSGMNQESAMSSEHGQSSEYGKSHDNGQGLEHDALSCKSEMQGAASSCKSKVQGAACLSESKVQGAACSCGTKVQGVSESCDSGETILSRSCEEMSEEEMEREFAKRFERENAQALKEQEEKAKFAKAQLEKSQYVPDSQDSAICNKSAELSATKSEDKESEHGHVSSSMALFTKIKAQENSASSLQEQGTDPHDHGTSSYEHGTASYAQGTTASIEAQGLVDGKDSQGADACEQVQDNSNSLDDSLTKAKDLQNKGHKEPFSSEDEDSNQAKAKKGIWRAFRARARRNELFRSLQFRIVMLFFIVGLITTALMCVMTYMKIYNTTREFVDEELSQISLVAINYKVILPRRWEAPRNNHGRIFRVQSINGRLVLTYGFEDESKEAAAHAQNRTQLGQGGAAPQARGQGLGHGSEAGAGRGLGLRASQGQNGGKITGPDGQPLTPSIVDIHKFKYDIIIAPLYGRPGDALYIPPGVADGFYTVMVADQRVRAFVSTNTNGQRFVVARPLNSIDSITYQAFISAVWQFVGIIFLFIPLLMLSVKWMFATLNKIAKSLYKRSEDDLSPVIPENHVGFVPSELDGFILALNRLFSKVDEGIHSKRRFIADAAHEMRTPLTALSLQAESLEKEELSPSARLKVERLKDGISRERQLMTSLLTLAREQNRTDMVLENIDIFDLYTKLIDEQGVLADRKNIDLGVEGNVRFSIVSDRMRLMRIMSNLLSNAIKYTPDEGRIDLMAKELGDGRLQLIVQDDGPGIPEDHLKHILEPFYRVGGDRSEIQGTGLGLAIVKASCESINANLEFSNAKPHGLIACVTMHPLDKHNTTTSGNRLLS